MLRSSLFLFVSLACVGTGCAADKGFVVDHTSLHLFDRIPERYLEAARNLRTAFMDRSVGVNTNDALDCLTASGYAAARVPCRRDFRETDGRWQVTILRDSAAAPPYIRFSPDPNRYDRSKWSFFIFADDWDKMALRFIRGLRERAIPALTHPDGRPVRIDPLDYDVLSFQFTYLNVAAGSSAAKFFTRLPGDYDDAYDLEREIEAVLERADPPRVFVYWTTSLARGIGTRESEEFNAAMRRWCRERGRILFDFADIQAHDMRGRPCFDNRDGVPYTAPNGSRGENHPDDGKQYPAICQENTTEADGGHLATAQGLVSIAKAFWIVMARVAGWQP